MATMVVKHRVADFTTWKKAFDEMHPTRASHGWTHHEIIRDADDPNTVVIINHMRSIEDGKAYGQSPVLRAAMEKGGILTKPEIQFFNDEEVGVY